MVPDPVDSSLSLPALRAEPGVVAFPLGPLAMGLMAKTPSWRPGGPVRRPSRLPPTTETSRISPGGRCPSCCGNRPPVGLPGRRGPPDGAPLPRAPPQPRPHLSYLQPATERPALPRTPGPHVRPHHPGTASSHHRRSRPTVTAQDAAAMNVAFSTPGRHGARRQSGEMYRTAGTYA